ncbi:MAG: FtsB family cell division protein [Beijerinckiaceae bacterium]
MVIRRRFSRILVPLALYAIAGGCAWFFVSEAQQGQRGLDAKQEIREEAVRINAELEGLRLERSHWERRVAQFKPEAMDRDLLDERVRQTLNRVHRHDVVILLPQRKP